MPPTGAGACARRAGEFWFFPSGQKFDARRGRFFPSPVMRTCEVPHGESVAQHGHPFRARPTHRRGGEVADVTSEARGVAHRGSFRVTCAKRGTANSNLRRVFKVRKRFMCVTTQAVTLCTHVMHSLFGTRGIRTRADHTLQQQHDRPRLRHRHQEGNGPRHRQRRERRRQDVHGDHPEPRVQLGGIRVPSSSRMPQVVPREPLRLPQERHHEGPLRRRHHRHRQRGRVLPHSPRPPPRGRRRRPLVRATKTAKTFSFVSSDEEIFSNITANAVLSLAPRPRS